MADQSGVKGELSFDAPLLTELAAGRCAVWLGPLSPPRDSVPAITLADLAVAAERMERFRTVLQRLFAQEDWEGRIHSPLLPYPAVPGVPEGLLVKGDHALPVTGSIKARGGINDLLSRIERIALAEGLVRPGDDYAVLAEPAARAVFAQRRILVASTGNLGYSIGLVARAFGFAAQVHMSADAKQWKKDRLVALGAEVIEHAGDYSEAVLAAERATGADDEFIDDTRSRDLMIGYALAGEEIVAQLKAVGRAPTPQHPLIVYLPCGVGGAPAGVTFALKALLGDAVRCVFVEPTASPCLMVALASGGHPVSVYDFGLNNRTIADGLAVPLASEIVLETVGNSIDAAVAMPDDAMLDWVRRAWREAGLRLEPSAAAAFAAIAPLLDAAPHWRAAIHVVWATGGSLLPDSEFAELIEEDPAVSDPASDQQ